MGYSARAQVAILDYTRPCRKGSPSLGNVTPGGPIRSDGTFALRERFTVRYRDGLGERFRLRVDGRFTAGGVTGSLHVATVVRSRRPSDRPLRQRTGRLHGAALTYPGGR